MGTMKKLNKKGDTIVEVLIAVVIVGLTISIAYAIATRSLRAAQQSQERSEAVKLAEGQVEAMKSIASKKSTENRIFGNGINNFCVKDDLTRSDFTPVPALDQDDLTGYPNECVFGPDGRYHVAISRSSLGGAGGRYQFSVTVRWFRLGSSQKDEVKIEYRLHPL